MKKLISITLAVVMLLSVLSVTAYAANNGPIGFSEMMMYYASRISLYDTDGNGNIKTEYIEEESRSKNVGVDIYGKDGVNNITGAAYDEKTNTLTLTNLKASDKVLSFAAMGDDFKLNIVGDCSLAAIQSYSANWSAGVTFTGSGKLTVNANKAFEYGFYANAYYSDSPITFDKGVKVDISGKKNAVYMSWSTSKDVNAQFTFNGSNNAQPVKEKNYYETRQWASGYYIDRTPIPDYVGPNATCLTDPDGIYIMGDCSTTDSDGNIKRGHWVNKLVYSKALGLYIEDPSFDHENLYPGDKDYDNYVKAEGSFYNTEKRYVDAYLDAYTDTNGNEYVYGEIYDQGYTNVVATYAEVPDVKGAYVFTEYKTGDEADEFVKTLTKKPSEFVQIGENTYRDASEIKGFFVKELEMDTDHLGVQVKSKDDPNGIYFMTWGYRYENWGEEDEKQIPAHWVEKYIYLEKQNIYIIDDRFEQQTFDYDTIRTSGYTPLVGEFNDDDDYGEHTYNYGKVNYIYGSMYEDKNGRKYIVDEIRVDGEYVPTAFDFEEIPELVSGNDKKYICTIAEGVNVSDLTELSERTEVEGNYNYYFDVADFTYDGGESAAPVQPAPAAKISKATASLNAGKTVTLKVTNGTVKSWTSGNKAVATVSAKGVVTALKKGTATITATLKDGKKLTCKVTVKTSPKFSKSSVTVKKNKTVSVKITGKASTVKNVYTNTKIAKITSKNTATTLKVKGLKKGSTTLKVKVNGVVLKLKVKVK